MAFWTSRVQPCVLLRWASPIRILSTSSRSARISMSAETPRMSSPSTGTWCVRGSRWVSSRSFPPTISRPSPTSGTSRRTPFSLRTLTQVSWQRGMSRWGVRSLSLDFELRHKLRRMMTSKLSHSRVPTPLKRSISRMLLILRIRTVVPSK